MDRHFSLTSAALGLLAAACGGSSAIGEAGSGGNGNGGSAGAEGGSGGSTTGGTAGTAGSGQGGSAETGGTAGTAGGEQGGAAGTETGGTGGTTPGAIRRPCEVLEGTGQTCVAAHSTVRVLVRSYSGPLYQVGRADTTTRDIGSVDGYADVAAQNEFCVDASCVVTIIYDQTSYGHHLTPSPPGSAKPTPGKPVPAHRHPVTINGRNAYGLLFRPGEGYRAACDDCPYPEGRSFTAVGDEPQTIYMVSSQRDLIDGCCLDYGNAETTSNNDGNGHMEAVYLGLGVIWGSGVGEGPWVMADLENGLYPGWENGQFDNISTNTAVDFDFVTAVLVGDTADKNAGKGRFALYGGDAASGVLKTMYDGIRPEQPGYVPMQKQGSIVLSISGDNSDGDGGRFYEGVMANGAATQETVDALQAAIVAAGYGR